MKLLRKASVDLFLSVEKNESLRDKMEGKYEVAIILHHHRGRENFFGKSARDEVECRKSSAVCLS